MHDFFPGLAGVPATKSTISHVDGQKGVLQYRGIPIEELAQKSTFAETAFLLLFNELPTKEKLIQFHRDLTVHRRIKYRITDLIKSLPEQGHPMDALQAAVAALGMFYPVRDVRDQEGWYLAAVRLITKLPTIVAAFSHGSDEETIRFSLEMICHTRKISSICCLRMCQSPPSPKYSIAVSFFMQNTR